MHESVPTARYSPVCNVLRQWKTSLILTYSVGIRPFVMYCVNGKPRSSLLIESIRPFVMYYVNGKPRSSLLIESTNSISKDERGFPLTQYITNGRISRGGYTFTHLNTTIVFYG